MTCGSCGQQGAKEEFIKLCFGPRKFAQKIVTCLDAKACRGRRFLVDLRNWGTETALARALWTGRIVRYA